MTDRRRKLTPKQRRFVEEYLVDLNATAAAKRAGYKAKTAYAMAHKLLKKAEIVAAIAAANTQRSERVQIDQDRVLRGLLRVAEVDMRQAFDADGRLLAPHELSAEVAAAISGVDVFEEYDGRGEERALSGYTKKIRLWDRVRALELLGKHLSLFTDKQEVTGHGGGPVQVVRVPDKADSAEHWQAQVRRHAAEKAER